MLASVLLQPPGERRLPELSLVAALAVAETVEATVVLAAQVKWPNDVMLNRRKVAGILSELSDGTVVVGIGINVNQTRDELPLELAHRGRHRCAPRPARPTTARCSSGSLLSRLERMYDVWRRARDSTASTAGLGARDFLRGRRITADGETATAIQILRDGRLEIETDAGEVKALESGEVLFER